MEDSLTDIPNLNFSSSGDQEVEEQIQENVGEISEENKDSKGKEEGGLINHLISNILSPRAGDEQVEEQIQENVGEISEERNVGEIINNFISNLMSPRAGDASNKGKNNFFDVKDEDNNKEDVASEQSGNNYGSGSGGIINNFISNIFHPAENAVETNQENSSGEGQKGGVVQENETEEATASVLDNIVSHLPTPLADDAVPATDEASILIHSIVHD